MKNENTEASTEKTEALETLLKIFEINAILPKAKHCRQSDILLSEYAYLKIFAKWSILTEEFLVYVHSHTNFKNITENSITENSITENSMIAYKS